MPAQNNSTDSNTRWEGYSDYRTVSISVGRTIEGAVEAYAQLDARHTENALVDPELAAEVRARIKSAAMKLLPELEQDQNTVDLYEEIIDDWTGENGYIAQLDDVQLQRQCPSWLYDMVIQIRKAGWELGYLKAGQNAREQPDDPEEAAMQEVKATFQE